ncbi:hypothetical protein [Sphingomonas sp. 35-24ZXX]|uniref:hypothetical protein n=1 Tax=Sphingomonas sp. 35-24ZXX TaxID=1545915 RepID=UPI00053BFA41|nr:hypothetical protein [Sphingomonas sp. 35-24ZXX]
MTQDKANQSVWNRIGTALTELDAAFDPAASVQDRLSALEARVDALEAVPTRDGQQDKTA